MADKPQNPRAALEYLELCLQELDDMLAHLRWGMNEFPALGSRDVLQALVEVETGLLWLTRHHSRMRRQLQPPPLLAD